MAPALEALCKSAPPSRPVIVLSCAAPARKLNRTPGAPGRGSQVAADDLLLITRSLSRFPFDPFSFHPCKRRALMNLTISGRHLEVTNSLREYVLAKLDRVTRHFDQVVDINVLLTVQKQIKERDRRQRAEVAVHMKGKDIFVESSHEDLYAAIDELMDKLDRQVCRHKDRLQNHHHDAHKRTSPMDLQ